MYTFTHCINKTNNTQIDNAEDFVKPMNKLLECNNNYAKTSASLWKYGRDEPDDDNITDSESFE